MPARELRLQRRKALLFPVLAPFSNRLPRRLWRWLYRPIPRSLREESLFESCQAGCRPIAWPASFSLDPALGRNLQDIHFLAPSKPPSPKIIEVSNAVVHSDGLIVSHNIVHSASSCYSRISPHILFRASAARYAGNSLTTINRATLISRQLIDQGTYGDYFIEFLLPLCRSSRAVQAPLLADADFIGKYCDVDLKQLGFPPSKRIPDEGVSVKTLTVIGPCQPFDNFAADNLAAVVNAFPAKPPQRERTGRFYLSRRGFVEKSSSKQRRSLDNEAEIEEFLVHRGFDILRPDGTNNSEMRNQLSIATIVIFNHGSGFFNAIWGRPRFVVELASEEWWNPAFLRLSRAMGVAAYHLLCSRGGRIDVEKLAAALQTCHD